MNLDRVMERNFYQMAVKLSDIAECAGVSQTTVSRVINGDKNLSVTKETEEKIWKYVHELNYRPSRKSDASKAKKKASGKVKNIGYILTQTPESFSDDFFSKIIYGIEQELNAGRHSLAFAYNAIDLENPILYNQMLNTECDGLIFVGEIAGGLYDRLVESYPCCMSVFTIRDTKPIDCISLDFEKMAFQVVSRMIDGGHRQIGYIGGTSYFHKLDQPDMHDFYMYEGRFRGYLKALLINHLEVNPQIVKDGEWNIDIAYLKMAEILDSGQLVTAVFAAGDRMALGAMRAIQERGLSIPGDISLAGFDDLDITRYLTPPLCTVSYPKEEMGRIAVRNLLVSIDRLERGEPRMPITTILPSEIIWRESVQIIR